MKTAFGPDSRTTVVLVKAYRQGDVLALSGTPATPAPPLAANDVCVVKLLVGPGNPGPAGLPSTSPGIGIEVWLPSRATAVKTKALTRAYYGREARWAYWDGFSTGGRQAHKLAQLHPGDFDGILAGAPAFNWTRFITNELYPQIVYQRDLGGVPLTAGQLNLMGNAAIAACDVVGGQHLGYIQDPSQCRYDPTLDPGVLCAASGGTNTTANCVSTTQARAMNKLWYGQTRNGTAPTPAVDNSWGDTLDGNHLWYGLAGDDGVPHGEARPICLYPLKAKYVSGDVDVASSYSCAP